MTQLTIDAQAARISELENEILARPQKLQEKGRSAQDTTQSENRGIPKTRRQTPTWCGTQSAGTESTSSATPVNDER